MKMIDDCAFHIANTTPDNDIEECSSDEEKASAEVEQIPNLADLNWDIVDELLEILNKFQLVLKYGQHHEEYTYANAGGLIYKLNNWFKDKDTTMSKRFRHFLVKRLGHISC